MKVFPFFYQNLLIQGGNLEFSGKSENFQKIRLSSITGIQNIMVNIFLRDLFYNHSVVKLPNIRTSRKEL